MSYDDVPKLLESIPGQKLNFFKTIEGKNVSRILRQSNGWAAMIKIDSSSESIENHTARIVMNFDSPLDLSEKFLVTTVGADKALAGTGYLRSRAQIELFDSTGKRLLGPKIHIAEKGRTLIFLRPSVTEPIPTGSFQYGFNIREVRQVSISFIVGKYPEAFSSRIVAGKFDITPIISISSDLLSKIQSIPTNERITRDLPNIGYEFRKFRWAQESNKFFVGINYPWNHYGWDVGKNPYGQPKQSGWSANEEKLRQDLEDLQSKGFSLVRIYVFFDLRTGLTYKFEDTLVFDEYVDKDLETMIRVAGETGMKVQLVLFDHSLASIALGGQNPNHPEFIFSAQKKKLLALLIPMLRQMDQWNKQNGNPVYAIELMNEPENMPILVLPNHFAGLKNWLKDLANIVHQETSFKVTLGSHSIVDMQRWWSDVQIDIWQFHYYDYMRAEHDQVPISLKRTEVNLRGPIICGELDPRSVGALEAIKKNGYAGAFYWSYNANDGIKINFDEAEELIKQIQN